MPNKYVTLVTLTASNQTVSINHSASSLDVITAVYKTSNGNYVLVDTNLASNTQVDFTFNSASLEEYKFIVAW